MKYWRAVNTALTEAFAEDDSLLLIGQDVAIPGGPFGMTRKLRSAYGAHRVRDTPISESAMMAAATGAAMCGSRTIVEIMFLDFMGLAMNQLVNQTAKYRYFAGDGATMPVVVSTLYGGRRSGGAQHSQSFEAWLCHVPGISVVYPTTAAEAYGVYRAALRLDDPVVVVVPVNQLTTDGELDPASVDISAYAPGTSRRVRSGSALTVVAYGEGVHVATEAVERAGVDAEIIDLRWLQPWDTDAVLESVAKTGKLATVHDAPVDGGRGGEVVATVVEKLHGSLRAAPVRIGSPLAPVPAPEAQWSPMLPNVETVATRLLDLAGTGR